MHTFVVDNTNLSDRKVAISKLKMVVGALLLPIFGILACAGTAYAAPDSLVVSATVEPQIETFNAPMIDRIAIRTNALDWMLTVPNIAFEMDLNGSEFNNITVGMSAKYNWNTLHFNRSTDKTYAPPAAYNLLDIRPEVRYWYRTRQAVRKKGDWSVESILKNRKSPKTWRANYVGAYANYGTYTFKFGKKGMQGHAFGVGASTGYSLPMYEYKNGAVDVELGFSVGLQLCTRDMFAHNPDGYFYAPVKEGTKGLHMTPFPVVSDMRVAFVWRHKSIKDKVKEDVERSKVKAAFNTNEVDYNYNDFTKARYDEDLANTMSSRERTALMANDTLYRKGYMKNLDGQEETLKGRVPIVFSDEFKTDPRVHAIVKEYEAKLYKLIEKRKKDAIRKFEKEWAEQKAEKAKSQAAAEKAAGDKAGDAEKPKKAPKEEKVKEPKPEKEKRPNKK